MKHGYKTNTGRYWFRVCRGAAWIGTGLVLAAGAALADAARGKELHDSHCQACHDTSVYTRENRQMESVAMLTAQVQRCSGPASASWSEEQVKDVVDYLNQTFYKF